jgi:uncharacterized Zn-binding protein involved in type VI secretion
MSAQFVARIGDTGHSICNGHSPNPIVVSFVWTTGSTIITADGLSVIRVGDICTASCGHTGRATTGGSSTADGLALHRIGDQVTMDPGGTGTTETGSSSITAV